MLRTLIDALHDLIFPPHCLLCERRLEHSRPPRLCLSCREDIRFLSSPWCRCCGEPFVTGADHLCGNCVTKSFSFDLARSPLLYTQPVSSLLLSLKFSRDFTVLSTLQSLVTGSEAFNALSTPDLILPVPLHIKRLRERTFNQALVLSRCFFPQWRKRIEPMLLMRKSDTVPQSRLSGRERRKNLRNVFGLTNVERVRGKNILIVDDVFTTGSTVNECAAILGKAGAERIEVFTPARTPANHSGVCLWFKSSNIRQ